MKKFWDWIMGRQQFAPEWWYRLPSWCQPLYDTGSQSFRWFGITISTPGGLPGDTIFMAWARSRGKKL